LSGASGAEPHHGVHEGGVAIFGRMGTNPAYEHSIPNAWMAASPGHPFFMLPIESARREVGKSRRFLRRWWYEWPIAELVTGPVALRDSILKYQNMRGTADKVILLPDHWVYPYSWVNNWNPKTQDLRAACSAEQPHFDASRCKEMLKVDDKGSVSITYWSHTHQSGKGGDKKNLVYINHPD
jgi:inositol phosphorylceramide mannosyltransferase catalytic subunit